MTVRIDRTDRPGARVLKIDGWLELPDLPEVERVCGEPGEALTLDLSGLRQADAAGLALLRRLRSQGAGLTGCSVYLAMRLGLPGPTDEGD